MSRDEKFENYSNKFIITKSFNISVEFILATQRNRARKIADRNNIARKITD